MFWRANHLINHYCNISLLGREKERENKNIVVQKVCNKKISLPIFVVSNSMEKKHAFGDYN